MFLKSRILFFIFIVLLSTLVLGCYDGKTNDATPIAGPQYGGVLRANLAAPVQTLDPAHFYDSASMEVGKEIFNGLVTIDPETAQLAPAHAKSWKTDDNRVYSFQLAEGARFHNGKEVTAEDFKYSFERILDPATASEISGMLMSVKGAKEKLAGKAAEVEGIRVKGKYRLEIELVYKMPGFINVLTHPGFAVVDKAAVEKAGPDFGTQSAVGELIGSGPFKVAHWNTGQVELESFSDYYSGKPYLQKVVYRFIKEETTALNEYRAGNLDIVERIPPGQLKAVRKEFPDQVITANILGVAMYLFNHEKAPFDNRDLRKAINYAVNRKDIILAMEGEAIEGKGYIPDGIPGFGEDLPGYEFNQEKALQFLEKAGYPRGRGLPVIELKYNTSEVNQRVAEIIQANLREVGIPTKLVSLEPAVFLEDMAAGNTQMFRVSWIADYPDAESFLEPLFSSAQIGNTNFGRYSNERFDQLLSEAKKAVDEKQRIEIYQEAGKILMEDSVGVILYYPAHTILVSPKVQGLFITKFDTKPLHKVWLAE